LPVHVFRLAGIYGAGRNVLEEVRAGTARRVHKPGQVFSRIHVDDIALSLCHSLAQPNPGRIYNVCDSHPCAPAEPVEYACQLLNVAPPPLLDWQNAGLSPMGISFYSECKRVKNERLVTELGVSLQYPDYREGLRSILEHMV
jgi:nucleoside-diphosphate-sugar epimerase